MIQTLLPSTCCLNIPAVPSGVTEAWSSEQGEDSTPIPQHIHPGIYIINVQVSELDKHQADCAPHFKSLLQEDSTSPGTKKNNNIQKASITKIPIKLFMQGHSCDILIFQCPSHLPPPARQKQR